jgi:hypothetical protein
MHRPLTETAAVQATQVLTTTGNAVAAETITIGTIVYTWKSTLAGPFDVLVGSAATNSLDNLKAAINHAAGEGSTYGYGTVAHPLVTATTKTSSALTVQAIGASAAGNSIGSTTTMTNATWGAAALAGGVDYNTAVTKTAAATGTSVSIADLAAAPYLIRLTVITLTPTNAALPSSARFSFPDSVNAFSASLPGPALAFPGPNVPPAPVTKTVSSSDYPGLRLGTTSAVIRCNLDALVNVATITYAAEIEQPQ